MNNSMILFNYRIIFERKFSRTLFTRMRNHPRLSLENSPTLLWKIKEGIIFLKDLIFSIFCSRTCKIKITWYHSTRLLLKALRNVDRGCDNILNQNYSPWFIQKKTHLILKKREQMSYFFTFFVLERLTKFLRQYILVLHQ